MKIQTFPFVAIVGLVCLLTVTDMAQGEDCIKTSNKPSLDHYCTESKSWDDAKLQCSTLDNSSLLVMHREADLARHNPAMIEICSRYAEKVNVDLLAAVIYRLSQEVPQETYKNTINTLIRRPEHRQELCTALISGGVNSTFPVIKKLNLFAGSQSPDRLAGLIGLIFRPDTVRVWIGLRHSANASTGMKWVDGKEWDSVETSFEANMFAVNETAEVQPTDCVAMDVLSRKWKVLPCTEPIPFICSSSQRVMVTWWVGTLGFSLISIALLKLM